LVIFFFLQDDVPLFFLACFPVNGTSLNGGWSLFMTFDGRRPAFLLLFLRVFCSDIMAFLFC